MKRVQQQEEDRCPAALAEGAVCLWGCMPSHCLCLLFETVLTPFSFLFCLGKAGKFISHLGYSRNHQVYVMVRLASCWLQEWIDEKDCDGSTSGAGSISELSNAGVCFGGFLDPNSTCCLLLSKAQSNLNRHECKKYLAVQRCIQQKGAVSIGNVHSAGLNQDLLPPESSSSELPRITCCLVEFRHILTCRPCYRCLSKQNFLWIFKNSISNNNVSVWLKYVMRIICMLMQIEVLLF